MSQSALASSDGNMLSVLAPSGSNSVEEMMNGMLEAGTKYDGDICERERCASHTALHNVDGRNTDEKPFHKVRNCQKKCKPLKPF